jgi:hypothetical protein
MIRVITIEREYGSGGGVIAEKHAGSLGWKLWDQLLTQGIARRMDCECHAVEKHEERRNPTVPLDSQNIWVTANFKETQMTCVRPGQHVEIPVGTYGRTYDRHIDSIAGASGARYSLPPPENATGNYVKVVQRIPVKIFCEKRSGPRASLAARDVDGARC